MEEKERYDVKRLSYSLNVKLTDNYEPDWRYIIFDDVNDAELDKLETVCNLLNQQDKELSKLQVSYQQVKEENQQLRQSQKQLAIKELEELQKEFDYCPYSGDKIYVAEVYDKIFAKIKELKGEIMEENERYELKERKMNKKYKMPEMEEMKSAFNKLAEETKEFLQKYYNPHTKIVADISGIEVVEGVLSKSFELND